MLCDSETQTYQAGKEHFRIPSHSSLNNFHVLDVVGERFGFKTQHCLFQMWSWQALSCLPSLSLVKIVTFLSEGNKGLKEIACEGPGMC